MLPGAACSSLPPRSRRKDFASSPASATRMHSGWSKIFNTESCWLVSVDGSEDAKTRWQILEEVLASKARSQRPAADLPVRRRAHRRNGAGERAEARERVHAPVRGLAGVPGPRDRAFGAALSRSPAAADVQGADGLHVPGQLLLAHARPRRRRGVPQEPGRHSCSTSSSARTRCAPTFRCRSARSARCSITPARSPRASETRRASSAPTKRSSSSAARPPPTRSSGTAWSARATSCSATATATSPSCIR